jgi:peptidoglycan/LPS O-acetylase OafA/YrhL
MEKRIPQLDAVRGLAILLVIVHNTNGKFPSLHLETVFANGWAGVDLFFVLSGFLITRILLDSKQSAGYFRNFYVRRCLRIWPLYYCLILFMFVIVPHFRPSEAAAIFAPRSSPWWAYPAFLQTFLVPSPSGATGPLAVTWSLAVEEQFYLIWPWIVRYASEQWLRRFAITVICASALLRLAFTLKGVGFYANSFCRLDGLMAGALLALVIRSHNFVPVRYWKAAWASLAVTAPLVIFLTSGPLQWIDHSFSVLGSLSFVYLCLFSTGKLQRLMTNRFLVYTGTISYGLYLLHKLPFDAAQSFHLPPTPMVMLICILASYILAALSWKLLEAPFLSLKRFFVATPVNAGAGRSPLLNTELSGSFSD